MAATHKIVNGVEVPLSQAEIDAFEQEWADNAPGTGAKWQADQAATLKNLREQAKAVYAETQGDLEVYAKAMRALALVALDEINILRQWLTSFKAEVAAAANLADLKTRIAGLPNTHDRTAAQLKTAIRNQIDAGNADE